jgi:uncharacterized membrane protein (DUF106 family)
MDKKNSSVIYNGLIWGLILAFVSIIFNVILYMLDQTLNRTLGYLGFVIMIVVMIFAIRSFRDNIRDGVLPFGPAFGFLITMVVVSTIIGDIYAYLLYTVIDPDILLKMKDMQAEEMMKRGIPEDQLDQALEVASRFMTPGMIVVFATAAGMFFGSIISLIIAAIFKKDSPEGDPVV